jgi:hypothetical protein
MEADRLGILLQANTKQLKAFILRKNGVLLLM